jgi:succinyl-CoA synthetase beta subunit
MARSAPEARAPQKLNEAATALLAQAAPAADGRKVMGEAASKQLLGAYGVKAPGEAFAADAEAAAQAADAIGYPVVLKLVSDDVQHKSDVGGVLIGLRDGQEVREGFARIAASLAAAKPGAHFGGVLVVQQVSGGTELVLGVHRDPEVGLVTMFGTGGVLLELVKDVAFGPVPLSEAQAADMIERTMAGRMLDGYRGGAKLDRAAVARALVGLSHLAQDLGERLESIDVNPLVALPSGALALDGLIVLKG